MLGGKVMGKDFIFSQIYEKMREKGYFDVSNENYLWLNEMEWVSPKEVLEAVATKNIIPFAFTGGGDDWVFFKENTGEYAIGICYACEPEGLHYAKNFEDALFRQILDFVSNDNFYIDENEMEDYQISEKELKEQLTEWIEKLSGIIKDEYIDEIKKLCSLKLKNVSYGNYEWYALLSNEEEEELRRKYMPYCLEEITFAID